MVDRELKLQLVGFAFVLPIAFALNGATGCVDRWDAVDRRSVAPVAGNPCGNLGVVCLDMQGSESGYCCSDGETCGGGKYSVGCPPGECCDVRAMPGGPLRTDGGEPIARMVLVTDVHSQSKPPR